MGYFAAVTDPGNTLNVPEGGLGAVPMARVCAVIWHAIGTLAAVSQNAQETATLRADRREALVTALGECISPAGDVVCAPGQSQRLVLVLQGCTPGVQVERYDAAAPVAQFVTAQAMSMHHKLGEGPWDLRVVRGYFDEAYLAGAALYDRAQRDDMAQQLAVLADMTYDLEDWTPPQG